jgi:hypothetical protein
MARTAQCGLATATATVFAVFFVCRRGQQHGSGSAHPRQQRRPPPLPFSSLTLAAAAAQGGTLPPEERFTPTPNTRSTFQAAAHNSALTTPRFQQPHDGCRGVARGEQGSPTPICSTGAAAAVTHGDVSSGSGGLVGVRGDGHANAAADEESGRLLLSLCPTASSGPSIGERQLESLLEMLGRLEAAEAAAQAGRAARVERQAVARRQLSAEVGRALQGAEDAVAQWGAHDDDADGVAALGVVGTPHPGSQPGGAARGSGWELRAGAVAGSSISSRPEGGAAGSEATASDGAASAGGADTVAAAAAATISPAITTPRRTLPPPQPLPPRADVSLALASACNSPFAEPPVFHW